MFKSFMRDLKSFRERDPAVRNLWEVFFLYAGYHALLFHRLAHFLWRHGFYFVGRFVSWFGRFMTQIEIHPAAVIADGLVIDHGSGLVIGETAIIGKNVTLYQGVTLGGISPAVNSHLQVTEKRHPTLEEGVIVGSGAHILGNITIGRDSRIGAGSVVIEDVPPLVTVVGIPARIVGSHESSKLCFDAYGIILEKKKKKGK